MGRKTKSIRSKDPKREEFNIKLNRKRNDMNKIKETLMITTVVIAFLTLTGVAKAEPNATIKMIMEMPTNIASHISYEVQKTKEYQAKSWAQARAQWLALKTKFLSN